MKKQYFSVFPAIFLISIFIFSACQPIPSAVFSDECVAPCWRLIKPGETKFQDAVNLVKKFPDLDTKNVAVWQPSQAKNIFSDIIGFNLINGHDIRVYAIEGIVTLITFYNPTGITFEDCIKEFGEPEYATQFSVLGPGGSPFFPSSAQHILFYAVSPKKGVVFGYDTENSFDLSENTKISDVSYFDIKLYDRLYQNNLILGFDPFGEIPQDKLHTWKGYGDIRDLYP